MRFESENLGLKFMEKKKTKLTVVGNGERPYSLKWHRNISLVYTEWANHYLEKANYSTFVHDIRVDLCTGVLLADIIHSVVHQPVPLQFTDPRNTEQKISNISNCLDLLRQLGVEVENISPKGSLFIPVSHPHSFTVLTR
ncbi:unnamed protein product [Echinostoma caproni]|uniref:Calponin-homology (CH) domain-containing protein n=1 Tax=Echinostoma caproni TaxID=27848 RepID=A0A183AXB9_9TREM|nr:unnamed protein product [Echinostoma caproni]